MNAELQLLASPFSFMQYHGKSSTPLKTRSDQINKTILPLTSGLQAVSQSMKSTDGLLAGGTTLKSAASKRSLMQAKRSSWFSFKQTGSSASTELEPQHRLSTEIHLDGEPCLF